MRERKWVVASLLLLIVVGAIGVRLLRIVPLPAKNQSVKRSPMSKPDSVLLPASETAAYIKFYLANPEIPVLSWQPTEADLDELEANLLQISSLKENVSGSTRHIDNPNKYFRQYLAIMQSGKRQIFVNAFCEGDWSDSDAWRHHLQVVYDGGKCYWQAWYDPVTQKFSNLMINGVA